MSKSIRLVLLIASVSLLISAAVGGNGVFALRDGSGGGLDGAVTGYSVQGADSSIVALDPQRVIFQELTGGLEDPLFITNAGDGSGRIFVLERAGRIRIIKNGTLLAAPFLDIQSLVKSTNGEQGLLALAFHPAFSSNGTFYVVYTATRNGDPQGSILTLRKYTASPANTDVANPASGVTLLEIDHPTYSNHNGGTLAFGQDGYLYWSTGDGGGGGDPDNNGQDRASLLGKILRLDVDSASPYAIPPTNPYFSNPDPNIRKEIWAYGLRNPWRLSFDRQTHDLYIGDVGQSAREEIDFQPANSVGGENYGWDIMEGSICYNASTCDQTNKVLPVAEYGHSPDCSVTGGYVYRGSNFPSLLGHYLYGDFCSGRVLSIYRNPTSSWEAPVQLADTAFFITTFGEDEQGELYLADYATGKIYRIGYLEPFYTISGNAGVPGATLSYTDGTPKTTLSQTNGSYSFQVPANWSGTVTPTRPCYTFSPANRPYTGVIGDQMNQDYTAALIPDTVCVLTILRTGSSPTNADSVGFTVTFTGDVTGVDAADFALTAPGVTGAAITNVSGTGAVYTVTVNTGTGDGTLRLDVQNTATITDLSANPLSGLPYINGEGYTIMKIARFMSADFNGDGQTDVAVFRPTNSTWYIQGQGSFVYGQAGDIPVPADYNGDGKDEIAVFRPSNSTWYIRGIGSFVYGTASDIPVVGDYNGDGKDDIAVFRPTNSTWYLYGIGPRVYGTVGDLPVVADYDGDGRDDIAVFRPSNSTWYLYGIGPRSYGTVGDIPVVADYNGDGQADIAVFRPSNSTWYIYGVGPRLYGTVGDIPVVGDYNGDGRADVAVFRPGNSTWYVYAVGPSLFGMAGDIPV